MEKTLWVSFFVNEKLRFAVIVGDDAYIVPHRADVGIRPYDDF